MTIQTLNIVVVLKTVKHHLVLFATDRKVHGWQTLLTAHNNSTRAIVAAESFTDNFSLRKVLLHVRS